MDRRKLVAILAADVAGYSKLMADDEAATLRSLNEARSLFRKCIEEHGGRLIDTAGDSILAEFVSPVEAVSAALEIQKGLVDLNSAIAEQRRMNFRIGINLGDVIEHEDGTIYGDGVNVAARLQTLAEPGAMCISGTAFDQVEGKLPIGFEFLGEQSVKNIAKPVRVYQLRQRGSVGKVRSRGNRRRRSAFAAVMAFVFVLVGSLVWHQARTPTVPASEKPTNSETNDAVLAMPTGPRLAVLPFANLSGDPQEDYFADGLTEDIITELSRFRDLYVLARNTTYQYKGQAVDVPTVGRKLGVQYLLEGSVRRSGSQVRITGQLIDVRTGAHIWADRYDRKLTDIFAVQDEITGKVVGTIAGGVGSVLQKAGAAAADRKRPDQIEAYDLVLRAKSGYSYSRESYPKAKAFLEEAIKLDPNYAQARQEYAWLRLMGFIFRFEPTQQPPQEIRSNAIKAVELDAADALAHRTAAFGYFFDHQLDLFEREAELAFERAPYNAEIFAQLGAILVMSGQYDRGLALAKKANSLNPISAAGWYHSARFYNFYRKAEYEKAIEIIRQHPAQGICETIHKFVSAYGQLGQAEQARKYWYQCIKIEPNFSPERVHQLFVTWNHPTSMRKQYMEGFAKAGLPCKFPDCEMP
jgi:adenylate cyclase